MGKGTCKSDDCTKEVRAKGYCDRHYRQWRKGKLPKARYSTCHSDGCRKPLARRGLCEEHYAKEYARTPAPTPAASTEAAPEAS